MKRRDFLKTAGFSPAVFPARSGPSPTMESRFPYGGIPGKIWAIRLDAFGFHEKVLLACMQGLVNSRDTRIYLLESERDQFWLDIYQKEAGFQILVVKSLTELLTMSAPEWKEYVLYDPQRPHSLNLATMLGAIHRVLPVSRDLEHLVKPFLRPSRLDAIRPAENRISAYRWALSELRPQCCPTLLAQLCVHEPHWPTSTWTNRDYVIAHKLFCFDLSTSERDKEDYRLVEEIYKSYPPETVVLGWHCIRDKEHEAIALSSRHGHFGLCSLHTPNLTVHTSVRSSFGQVYRQPEKKDIPLEEKVYIAFMDTDGDASWFMLDLAVRDWKHPLHGKLKYNWGFLPLAYDLMPGVVDYYLKNQLETDYFVAGPAGATYTYPHLHPEPSRFLRLSQEYMRRCGLAAVHITNWDDRDWWQEVDLPGFPALLCRHMPRCQGFLRGMGESVFEANYLDSCKPYVFFGEGIHANSDVLGTLRDFIDANPNRPLFIFCLVNHTVPQDRIQEALDRLSDSRIVPVHVDELLKLVQNARRKGKIPWGLYPHPDGNRNLLKGEARQAWPRFHREVGELGRDLQSGDAAYAESLHKTPVGLEPIPSADALAFQVIWKSMELVKLSLEARGIYVNHKPSARKRFVREFRRIPDVELTAELEKLWGEWHRTDITYPFAHGLANRMIRLTERIHQSVFTHPA